MTTPKRLERKLNACHRILIACATVAILSSCATTVNPESSSRQDSLLDVAPDGKESPTAENLYAMAHVLATKDQPGQAARLLAQSVDTYPQFAPAYSALADLQLQQGRLNDAVEVLTSAVEIHSEDGVLLNNLGVCHILQHDYQAALECFQAADRANPFHRRYQANIALALGLLGRTEEAAAAYQGVLSSGDIEHNLQIIAEMAHSQSTANAAPTNNEQP